MAAAAARGDGRAGAMGFFKRLFESLGFGSQKCNILIVGLDDAGKTTILNQIMPKNHRYSEVVPTVGFKVEQFSKANINFTMFDMSGASTHRDLWTAYYGEAQVTRPLTAGAPACSAATGPEPAGCLLSGRCSRGLADGFSLTAAAAAGHHLCDRLQG